MKKPKKIKSELHYINRIGWLRASILGANDGILSIASILGGMISGNAPRETILLAGIAALAAGATAMATGEYVSVSSQSDAERADLAREKKELKANPEYELEELAQIYVKRGLDLTLARKVAAKLMKHDALGAHARDELGISEIITTNPLQAALASAASFMSGGLIPLLSVLFVSEECLLTTLIASALSSLALLGAIGANTGGVPILKPTIRIFLWGSISLGVTTIVGHLFSVNP